VVLCSVTIDCQYVTYSDVFAAAKKNPARPGQPTSDQNAANDDGLDAGGGPCGRVEAQGFGIHEADAELGGVGADVLGDVGGGVDVALAVGEVGPVAGVGGAPRVRVGDGVPELVARRLDGMPAEPPVVSVAGYCGVGLMLAGRLLIARR
jgi:hypothetical protein